MTDLLIFGAGTAGLMAAMEASARGLRVTVVDHAPVIGRKFRLAGGGKGNVTNLHMGEEWFVSREPKAVAKLLKTFPPRAVLALLDSFRIPYEEREHGQIFCTVSVAKLVAAMEARCRAQGVHFLLNHHILDVEYDTDRFIATVDNVREQDVYIIHAEHLLLALGSSAWPVCGATDLGLQIARHFGHSCTPFRPALAGLILPEQWALCGLQGVSVPVNVTVGDSVLVHVDVLFTHKGLSGPAALHASCLWQADTPIVFDFMPTQPILSLFHTPENGRYTALALLKRNIPLRLARALLNTAYAVMDRASIPRPHEERGVAQWNKKQRNILAQTIHQHTLHPLRNEGMHKAEAAGGGVRLENLCLQTLESQLVPKLFFAGELLDVVGLLGGYNIHWALTTGRAVAHAIK